MPSLLDRPLNGYLINFIQRKHYNVYALSKFSYYYYGGGLKILYILHIYIYYMAERGIIMRSKRIPQRQHRVKSSWLLIALNYR